jgi:hypothetical protein
MNTFTIPLELCSLNDYINAERRNRFIAAKIKKDTTELIIKFCSQLSINKEKQHDVVINWHTKDKRKDSDNIFFASKFIFDGIVKAEKLSGDGYKNIRNIHHNRFIGESKIEIIFTEV